MRVRNHRIDDIYHGTSSNLSSGTITPRFIVNHYTAGWNGAGARNWLMGRAGGTGNKGSSAHLVIDLDGTAWQIAPFNRKAWHAGPSKYGSVKGLNSHSIGIEYVNPGFLKSAGGGAWVDANGSRKTEAQLEAHGGYMLARHSIVGSGTYAWPIYPEAQLETGRRITQALIEAYDIQDIITHEEIDTRGWKTDPGPAFPQDAFKEMLGETDEEDGAAPLIYEVSASRLNLRGGPSAGADRVDPPGALVDGTRVQLLRRSGKWGFVSVISSPGNADPGVKGWVHMNYVDRVF
ncbi:MAG: N-acetylmuramoyl-L-alanine amidase [Marinibacterium sp.]|nr:N-acetylmuramoyl-L-alanine amidase [Marinibacterium sp.]